MPDQWGSFIWYELMTKDAAAVGSFYAAVVPGWRFGERMDGSDVDYRMIHRSDGGHAGGVLQISSEMEGKGARPVWLGYLAVPDVDQAVQESQTAGAGVLMEPWDTEGVGRMAMITDPQGAPIYLMKPQPPEGAPDGVSVFSMDQPQRVRWNELATSDPDGAIAFYTGQFGWTQEGDMDMGEYGKYRFLQHGANGSFGAVMPKMPQMPSSLWTFYIGVENIDRSAEAIRQNGGQIVQEPIEIPGGEYSLVGVDPQGASFGLVGPRK